MPGTSDEIHLIIQPITNERNNINDKFLKNDNAVKSNNIAEIHSKRVPAASRPTTTNRTTTPPTQNEDAEERQRTGRYLAVGVTLVMLFIAFYHTIPRHRTVLAGLLAPAIIMLLYILWLLYFAKKRKRQVTTV